MLVFEKYFHINLFYSNLTLKQSVIFTYNMPTEGKEHSELSESIANAL